MTMFCPECNNTIKPYWEWCHSCGAQLVKEQGINSISQEVAFKPDQVKRKKYFWKLNFTVAIFIAATLVLPYQFVHYLIIGPPSQSIGGYWWLLSFGFNYNVHYSVLIFAIIHIILFVPIFNIANVEKNSKSLDVDTIKKRNIILIILGAILIITNIFLLNYIIPPQYPSVLTTVVPVGLILAFLAGGFAIFSGILGLLKEN